MHQRSISVSPWRWLCATKPDTVPRRCDNSGGPTLIFPRTKYAGVQSIRRIGSSIAHRRTDAGTGKQFLFPSQSTGQPLRREPLTKWWGLARERAGIVGSPGAWHKLRREFATNLLDQPVNVVRALSGSKNPMAFTQIYRTVDMQRMRDALKSRKAVSNR